MASTQAPVHRETAGDEQAASTARFASVAQFVRRHGVETLDEVLEKLDDYLSQHKPETLDDALRVAPVFGNLLGRSRKQLNHALEGIADEEHTWMILTFNPEFEKRKECFTIRSVIGDCGPITVSFADQLGGRRSR